MGVFHTLAEPHLHFETLMDDVSTTQAQERRKQQLDQERADLDHVMDTPAGRRHVWRQLERAGVFRSSFCGESSHTTSFNEGQRNLGVMLLADIHRWCPDKYVTMLQENTTRERR